MKIAVYGSAAGDIPEKVRELAREIGRQIALRGHILITGGCPVFLMKLFWEQMK